MYSGLLKIRTPKNPDFCVFAKQDLSENSGLFHFCQTRLVLKIRTYESADMEFFSNFFSKSHLIPLINFRQRSTSIYHLGNMFFLLGVQVQMFSNKFVQSFCAKFVVLSFWKMAFFPKNPHFCLFLKQDLSKKSGLLRFCQTGLFQKIRTFTKNPYTCESGF